MISKRFVDDVVVLRLEDVAIIYRAASDDYEMQIPANPDGNITPRALALTACFVRLAREEEFRKQMHDWFMQNASDGSTDA